MQYFLDFSGFIVPFQNTILQVCIAGAVIGVLIGGLMIYFPGKDDYRKSAGIKTFVLSLIFLAIMAKFAGFLDFSNELWTKFGSSIK